MSEVKEVPKIFAAINKIMSELGPIDKNQTNTFHKYQFRGIDDIVNASKPLLVKHKVFPLPQVVSETHQHFSKEGDKITFRVVLRVKYLFTSAEDGSSVEAVTSGEGIDTSDKATNKAMTGAYKNALIEIFSINTKDNTDPDNESPEAEGEENGFGPSGKYIVKFGSFAGRTLDEILKVFGPEKLSDAVMRTEESIGKNKTYKNVTIKDMQEFVDRASAMVAAFERGELQ